VKVLITVLLLFNLSGSSAFAQECGRFDYACANKSIRHSIVVLERYYIKTLQETKKNISVLRGRVPTQEMMANLNDVQKSVDEITVIVHDEKVELYEKMESLQTASVFKDYRINSALGDYVEVLDDSIKGLHSINETLKIANHELGYSSL
jgi:hypothetical protein